MAKIDVTEAFQSLEAKFGALEKAVISWSAVQETRYTKASTFIKAHVNAAYLLAGGILGFIAGHFL